AEERGHRGKWAILNTRSSVEPFLTYSGRRNLRERVWRTFTSRGDNGDTHDNKRIIADIVRLRDARAKLLGYPSHAHWRLEMSMAKRPEQPMARREGFGRLAARPAAGEWPARRGLPGAGGAAMGTEPWNSGYKGRRGGRG